VPKFIKYSKELITTSDIEKLLEFSLRELDDFTTRNPSSKLARVRPLAICLCQGAALHFINQGDGIKDFDIYFFYEDFYARAIKRVDSSSIFEKFGVWKEDWNRGFKGRRIDFCRRKIGKIEGTESIKEKLVDFLSENKTDTARNLAKKAVIGLWPKEIFKNVIWQGI
jgi:hypothetical protein